MADGGIDMTDLQGVIGLLYRADWTGLSLAADVRSETDQDLLSSRVRAVKPSWVPEGRGRSSRGVYPEGGPPTWADAISEEPGGLSLLAREAADRTRRPLPPGVPG